MIFDCVFLHRNVLEAVTSPGSPHRPSSWALRHAFPPGHPTAPCSQRSPAVARPGWGAAAPPAVPLSHRSRDPAEPTLELGICWWHRWLEQDMRVLATSPSLARAGAGAVGVALGHAGTQRLRNWSPRFVYPLYISQTWKLKKVKFMRKI